VPVKGLPGAVITHCGAWVGVAGSDLDVPQIYPSIQTGRERFTSRAEYLKLRSGEMGPLVLLGPSLPLPRMHQWVTRRYRS
jgi:hypothetical protein